MTQMVDPIRIGLAVAATASFGLAHGEPSSPHSDPAPWLDTLFESGARVTYVPGSGMTVAVPSAADFSLNVSGQVQPNLQYRWGEDIEDSTDFELASARLRFGGDAYDGRVSYFVQLDAEEGVEGNGNVVDAWAMWHLSDTMSLRFGQQKMRSSLQADASLSDTDLEMAQMALATRAFAGRRSTGALFQGKAGTVVQWHAGVMNNSTAGFEFAGTQDNDSDELDFTFGALTSSDNCTTEGWSEGDLAHAGAAYITGFNVLIGNGSFPGSAADNDMTTVNAFVAGKSGTGLAAQAEIFVRSDDDGSGSVDNTGFYVQGSYTQPPGDSTQWGLVVRASAVDVERFTMGIGDLAVAPGTATEISLGVNAYHHRHKLKTQVMLSFLSQEPDSGDTIDSTGLDVLFTLMF